MGKIFYGTHSDKLTARIIANNGARAYKKGVCWTPSKEESCVFDENTKLWTCHAAAHHHEGSCGTWEIHHRGNGLPWQLGYTCDENGCRPYIGSPVKSISIDFYNSSIEEYSDASPEDYFFEE